LRCQIALVATLALTARGTTASLRHGSDIAEAGKAYSGAIQTVADVAIEKHVEWLANGAISAREPAAITGSQLGTTLDLDLKGSREFVHQLVVFKAHAQRLGDYFDALGKLENADVKQPYIDSAKELAGSVDTLGKAFQAVGIAKDLHVNECAESLLTGPMKLP
jgi:hypothetical protein